MELTVLGSSSSGNGYVLRHGDEALVIECGVPVAACLKALGYKVGGVVGVLISHEHGDHAKYAATYADYFTLFCSAGTAEGLQLKSGQTASVIAPMIKREIGGFTVLPFAVKHDSAEPYGYLIRHEAMGTLMFATDTRYLPCRFAGLNQVMIECNYATDIIKANVEAGKVHKVVMDRTFNSHFSIANCIDALKANDLSDVRQIVLIHLSKDNADPTAFTEAVKEATGKQVTVAKKGLTIDFTR